MEPAQVLLLCTNISPFRHDPQKIISEEESDNEHALHNFKEKSFGLIPDIRQQDEHKGQHLVID